MSFGDVGVGRRCGIGLLLSCKAKHEVGLRSLAEKSSDEVNRPDGVTNVRLAVSITRSEN